MYSSLVVLIGELITFPSVAMTTKVLGFSTTGDGGVVAATVGGGGGGVNSFSTFALLFFDMVKAPLRLTILIMAPLLAKTKRFIRFQIS
jgi:hypothetical protein